MLGFNRQNLRTSHELKWLVLDFFMLGLLVINLGWIILDTLFAVGMVHRFLEVHLPDLVSFYTPVHRNFLVYDLSFVAVFLTDFAIRWIHSVRAQRYDRWYFFPFIHWYDLIGCIPLAGLRILRFLRVLSIVFRLQKYGVIDITGTRIFQFVYFYYDVLLEELTDRIVVKAISGAQEEIRQGSPVLHRVQNEILRPRRDLMVQWLSEKIAEALSEGYIPNESSLRKYLEKVVDEAMDRNKSIQQVQMIPMLGPAATDILIDAVGDIVFEVIHRILKDVADKENHAFVNEISQIFIREREPAETGTDNQLLDVVIEALELVKDQVRVKRWQQSLNSESTI